MSILNELQYLGIPVELKCQLVLKKDYQAEFVWMCGVIEMQRVGWLEQMEDLPLHVHMN